MHKIFSVHTTSEKFTENLKTQQSPQCYFGYMFQENSDTPINNMIFTDHVIVFEKLRFCCVFGKFSRCHVDVGPDHTRSGLTGHVPRDKFPRKLHDTLVSGQLFLRPPCLKPLFNSHTNSVFLHSRKRLRTPSEITTLTFSLF